MKLRNRTLIRIVAQLVAFASRCLFLTVRIRIIPSTEGFSPHLTPDEKHRSLFCIWHDAILGAIFCGKTESVAALTSQNYDGSIVAEILSAVGIQPVRGSSSRGGAAAIRQMFALAEQKHVVIATDGPRGPRRVVKDGIVYLASHSGRPIIPTAFASSWAWKPKGKWTDLVVPFPFSRGIMLGGDPIRIPPGLRPQDLAPYQQLVQRSMDELQLRADRMACGENVDLILPLLSPPLSAAVDTLSTDETRPAQAA